ncbi:MAG: preprotein translocase subunit YajC [Alphaproteobacteria bacterium]|nr:preprotein translocase subunit YajC [Alphaproteobacteria bacterium]
MLISKAYAAADAAAPAVMSPEAPSAMEAFGLNMLLIAILVVMFYVLLIMPQQKRFQQHREMLGALKKGDRVITAGGLIGHIDTITEGSDEIIIDLGGTMKVTALRTSIQSKPEKTASIPMNDKKKK